MSEEVLEEVLEELSVLSAIYCGSEELELIQHCAETGFIYRIQTSVESDGRKTPLSLIFHLPPEYPQAPPDVSVSSAELSRKQCGTLREGVLNAARSLPPGPMIHDLVLWLQQNFSDLVGTSEKPESQNPADSKAEELWTALLHLDHMRSRARYIKLIEKWTSELGLAGRLYLGKLILILLQGERTSIKEFIHLQRTTKVDVDSSGKRCKEKMMSVLCEIPLSEDFKKISAFEVREASSLEELKEEFDETGSLKLYREFVPSLL